MRVTGLMTASMATGPKRGSQMHLGTQVDSRIVRRMAMGSTLGQMVAITKEIS